MIRCKHGRQSQPSAWDKDPKCLGGEGRVDGSADPTFFDGSVDRCAGVRQQPAQSPKG